MNHDEYHRKFADAIIEQIKQGTAPWQKPWAPGERVMPMNVDT
ncbi:MAG: ArdC family protein, partial [Gemmatimonadota bacterium]